VIADVPSEYRIAEPWLRRLQAQHSGAADPQRHGSTLGFTMPLNHASKFFELTDEQYVALGKVVVEWANIEQLLSEVLGRMLRTPDFLARTYTDALTAHRLQSAIEQASEIHRVRYNGRFISPELLTEIAEINVAVTSLRGSRNKIAHFCWCRQTDESIFGTNFSGGVYTPKSEQKNSAVLTLGELATLVESEIALVRRLSSVLEQVPSINELNLELRETKVA
jgi:hypothetical protein